MKKLITVIILFFALNMNAQIRFIDKEYFTASIAVDPSASVKEGGVNVNVELELVSYWKYVKVDFQTFPALLDGYNDLAGGFGANITLDKFDRLRIYTGGRLGFINRGKYIYPISGLEGGVDVNLGEKFL